MIEFVTSFGNFLMPVFYKVLYMSIVGSILGIFILFITKVFDSKISAKWKCLVWIIPLMFLIIPINRIQISTKNDFAVTTIVDKVESSITNAHTLANKDNITSSETVTKIETNADIDSSEIENQVNNENNKTKITGYMIIPIIWLAGTTISILIIIIGNISLNYRVNHTKKIEDSGIKLILAKCKIRLQITKPMEIRLQNVNTSPCIYGIMKPKILVSEEFIKNNSDVIENVFMHELSHYKRKDMVTNTILLIMTAVHWFNPLVYRFFKKIRQEMELATDEIALSKMDKLEKKQYGLTLIQLLQTYETSKTATKMLCITDDNKNMERRIEKIKWSTKLKKYRISIILLIILIIFCIMSPFVVKLDATTISKEDEKLYNIVEQYLIKTEEENHRIEMNEFAQNGDDFKVFIDMAKLGVRKNHDETYVYVWALIQSCHAQEELVTSGSSMGYKFIIKDNEVIDYQIPEDGEMYEKSIEEIFPEDIRKKIEKADELVDSEKIEKQIEKHYSYLKYINTNNIQNVNTDYVDTQNVFVGKWSPYKAEQNGEEIPLSAVYGSGIAYGGELILNSDETYTEFIGIYSEDALNDLQGKYRRYGNGEKAILTTNNKETKILEMLESSKDNSNVNSDEATLVLMTEGGIHVYFKRVD